MQHDLENTLRELQVVFEHASIGISFIRQRTVQRCNPRFAQIFGYDHADALTGTPSRKLYPDAAAHAALGAAGYPELAAGKTFRTRIQMQRRSGETFWCDLTAKLIRPDAPDEGSVWIVEDIQDLMNAEAALSDALVEQDLILQHALVGIVFLRDRRVQRCNRLFEQQFGYAPGELNGELSRRWYRNEAEWLEAGRQCYEPLRRGDTFRAEMLLGRKDGSDLWCDVLAKAIDPQDMARGSIWITLDITARRQAEAALQQVHAHLEQLVAQRTRELDETVQRLNAEVDERRQAEARIRHLALHDVLTGLPNRSHLELSLTQALTEARAAGEQAAVMFLDLDRFKQVNDSLGHAAGDDLLREVAQRLRAAVPPQATLARQGGDEFVLVLPRVTARQQVAQCLRQIEAAFREPVLMRDAQRAHPVAFSIGVSLFPDDGEAPQTLLQHADMAMYQAKAKGRNRHQFFQPKLDAELQARMALEHALHQAMERKQFELHYQPQIDVISGRITGVEALLRWNRPGLGWESPARFIPVAEEIGLIPAMGSWVLEQACAQAARWLQAGLPPLQMAVNVSPLQLENPAFARQVQHTLDRHGLMPSRLEVELTEGVMLRDHESTIRTMAELHRSGVVLSMDDFGTGYSSLSYLSRLPLRKLKIDRTFVQHIESRVSDAVLCRTIVAMAQNLSLRVTAEGVETPVQLRLLTQYGVDQYQGYLFGPALPATELEHLLAKHARPKPGAAAAG